MRTKVKMLALLSLLLFAAAQGGTYQLGQTDARTWNTRIRTSRMPGLKARGNIACNAARDRACTSPYRSELA